MSRDSPLVGRLAGRRVCITINVPSGGESDAYRDIPDTGVCAFDVSAVNEQPGKVVPPEERGT